MDIHYNSDMYYDVIHNSALCERYEAHLTSMGVEFTKYMPKGQPAASTDMGNVSYVVPSIQPHFSIGAKVVNHSREFTAAAGQ